MKTYLDILCETSGVGHALLGERAPPGEKAEHFIKKHKKEFKKRYGDAWKQVLYATAWKRFS